MGKEVLVELSHPFSADCPLWHYFEDVKAATSRRS
jgi:kynurenine formamidase